MSQQPTLPITSEQLVEVRNPHSAGHPVLRPPIRERPAANLACAPRTQEHVRMHESLAPPPAA
eukprot:487702-Prymnesium_polylepis.1